MDSKKMQELFAKKVLFFNKYAVLIEDYRGTKRGYFKSQFDDPPVVGNYYRNFMGKDGKNFVLIAEGEKKFYPQIEDLCIVKKIDKDFIYLIKNGDKNVIKLKKNNEDYSPLDLVYIDGNNLIKDQYFTKYFKLFLEKFDGKVELKKNNFKMHRYVIEYIYKHAVSLCDFDDIKKISYAEDFNFNPNFTYGDIYIKIELDSSSAYIYEEELDPLTMVYTETMYNYPFDNSSLDTQLKSLMGKIEFLREKRNILEEFNKKTDKYYKLHPLPYANDEIIAKYEIMELEFEDTFRLSNCNRDDDYDNYVNIKDLPPFAREKDIVLLVKDKKTNQKKYYFAYDDHSFSFDYEIFILETKIDGIKDKLFFNN